MFGFKAFAEAPIAAEKEQAQAQPYVESGYWEYGYAEGDQQVSITNVGAIGASAIGVHAIGRATATEVVEQAGTNATGSAGLDSLPISVTSPSAQATTTSGAIGQASIPQVTLTAPQPTVGAGATVEIDAHKARQTFAVTVQSTGSGNKYYINGTQQASLSLHEEGIYRFDVSDSSVSGHPFKFSTTSDGTHNSGSEYTTNVTVVGTAGNTGAYVEIEVTSSTPDLYYYCGNHSGMGGSITFVSDFTQVPFIVEISAVSVTASGGAIAEATAAQVSLTAAEATASGAAEATFADSIEVGVTAPQPNSVVLANGSIPSVSITSPQATAFNRVDASVTITDALNVTVTSADADGALGPFVSTTATREVSSLYRRTNFSTLTLSFPTQFTVSSAVSSTYAGTWTVNSYSTHNTRLIRWDKGTTGSYDRIASVWFSGKKTTQAANETWYATWKFDDSGNLTLTDIGPFMQWASNPTDGAYQLRSSGFIHGDLETHPNASGDFQLITPALATYPSSSSNYGTWGYVNVRQLNDRTDYWSATNANSINNTPWALGQITTNSDTVTLVSPGTTYDWPSYAYALPWRGDWGSRSRQNYLLWSYSITSNSTTTYYLKLAAENGDVVSVQSTTSSSTHYNEAQKFADGTYTNLCVGDSVDSFKWWHDDSDYYKNLAEDALSTSNTIFDIEKDTSVEMLDGNTADITSSITAPEGTGGTIVSPTASAGIGTVSVSAPSPSGDATGQASLVTVNVSTPEQVIDSTASASLLAPVTQTLTVTVSGGKYYIDGVQQASLSLHEEGTYTFDVSHSSVSSHPFRFSTTSNGTHNSGTEYTTGVTTNGTAGQAGAYVRIVVTSSTPDLYYYCSNHSGMGGSITFVSNSQSSSVTSPEAGVDGNASASLVTVNVTSPEAGVNGSANASLVTVNIQQPTGSMNGVEVPDAMPSISVSSPQATAEGDADVTITDTLEVTVTDPDATATTANIGSASIPQVDVSAPEPSISCNPNINDLSSITVSSAAPNPIVVAFSNCPSVDVTAAEPSATGQIGGQVSDVPEVSVTAPTVTASETGKTAQVSVGEVTVSSPEPTAKAGCTAEATIPQITVSSTSAETEVSTFTGFVTSTLVSVSIDGTGFVDATANGSTSDIGVNVPAVSVEANAEVQITDTLSVTVSSPEPTVEGNAGISVADLSSADISVLTPSVNAFSQEVIITTTAVSNTYQNQTTISWGSTANQNTGTVEEGVIVLLPYGVTNPTGGTPFKPLLFATNNPSSTNAFVLQVREFTSDTATSLITEYSVPHQNVQPTGYSSTSNAANFNRSAIYLDNSTRYTDSDGVEWPTVVFGYEAKSRFDYTDSNETTTKWHHKWVELAYNPVSESIVTISKKYDVGQSVIDSGTYTGGIVGGHARNLTGNKLTFEFLYLNSFVGSNNVRQYRAEHHQLRVDTGVETRNLTSQTVTTTKSTWTSARSSMLSTIEGRDTDVTHIEGIADDSVTYSRNNISSEVRNSAGSVVVTSPSPTPKISAFASGNAGTVTVGNIDGVGREDRLVEVDLVTVGVGVPNVSAGASTTAEPNGPGQIDVTAPSGIVSQLTTTQEIDLVTIDATAPEATANFDYKVVITDALNVDIDAALPTANVATTSPVLNVDVTAPETTLEIDSEARPALVTVSVFNPEETLEISSDTETDLLSDQVVSVSPPEPTVSVSAVISDLADVSVSVDGTAQVSSEARPNGANVIVTAPEPTVTSEGNATGTSNIGRVDVTAPEPTLDIDSEIIVDVGTVDVTVPTSDVFIVAEAQAATVQINAPEPQVEIDTTGESSIPNVSVSTPVVSAGGGSQADADLVTVDIVTLDGIAITIANPTIDAIDVTAPEPTIQIDGDAQDVLLSAQPVSVTAPDTTVETIAEVSIPEISVVSPDTDSFTFAQAPVPQVSVTAPEPNVTTIDDFSLAQASIDAITVVAPIGSASGDGSVAGIGTVTVTAPDATAEVEEFPTNIPPVDVTAPEATVILSVSERTVFVEAESRVIVIESEIISAATDEARVLQVEFDNRTLIAER